MTKKKVLVLGEVCIDEFVYGRCERLNPEAPSPIITPTMTTRNYGMAGNTHRNLLHLGLDPEYHNNIYYQHPIKKTRYVEENSNYILLRVDEGDNEIKPLVEESEEQEFIDSLDLPRFDAVVVSDYNKGLLSNTLMQKVFVACDDLDIPTFLDTKKKLSSWAHRATFVKINEPELNAPHHHIEVLNKFMYHSLIVTRGGHGATYMDETYHTESSDVVDVVGAGDTFLAGLVYGYLKDGNIVEAIKIANKLATNVVGKSGVALPDLEVLE